MDTAAAPRRLYKSRRNRFIDGICGGIAEFFQVDPTIVRLLWVLVTLLGGSGIILYIVGMIVIPVNPEHILSPFPAGASSSAAGAPAPNGGADKRRFFGILVMLLGVFFLVVNLGWFEDFSWWWFSRTVMLPVFMILLGLIFVYTHTRKNRAAGTAAAAAAGAAAGDPSSAASAVPPPPPAQRELRRSLTDRKLFGVCGGLAAYFGLDATIVRLVFVFMVIASFGWGLLLYILLGIIVQEERPGMAQGGRL